MDVSPTLLMQIVRTALVSEGVTHGVTHTRNNEGAVSGKTTTRMDLRL